MREESKLQGKMTPKASSDGDLQDNEDANARALRLPLSTSVPCRTHALGPCLLSPACAQCHRAQSWRKWGNSLIHPCHTSMTSLTHCSALGQHPLAQVIRDIFPSKLQVQVLTTACSWWVKSCLFVCLFLVKRMT